MTQTFAARRHLPCLTVDTKKSRVAVHPPMHHKNSKSAPKDQTSKTN